MRSSVKVKVKVRVKPGTRPPNPEQYTELLRSESAVRQFVIETMDLHGYKKLVEWGIIQRSFFGKIPEESPDSEERSDYMTKMDEVVKEFNDRYKPELSDEEWICFYGSECDSQFLWELSERLGMSITQRFHRHLFWIDKKLLELMKDQITVAEQEVLNRVKFINKRQHLLEKIVYELCQHQAEYLKTGDPLLLKPLTKSDLTRLVYGRKTKSLAKAAGERPAEVASPQSTVSRLLKNKWIDTPHGQEPLEFFCPKIRDVVYRLIEADPDKTGLEISELLRKKYGCKISRRTVNHYRKGR